MTPKNTKCPYAFRMMKRIGAFFTRFFHKKANHLLIP